MPSRRMPHGPEPETATQTLHRLTSFTWSWYEPSREDDDLVWSVPVDDPPRRPGLPTQRHGYACPGSSSGTPRRCLGCRSPAICAPRPRRLSTCSPGPRTLRPPGSTSRTSRGCSTFRPASFGPRSIGTRPGCSAPPAPRAAASPSSCTSRCPTGSALPRRRPLVPPGRPRARAGRAGPARGRPRLVVVTGVPWRTGWRYRERGFRHVYWDAGTMLSQLLAAADSAGHPDSTAHALPGRRDRRRSSARTACTSGPWRSSRSATARRRSSRRARPSRARSTRHPVEFPLVTAAQRAGELDVLGPGVGSRSPGRGVSSSGPSRSRRSCSRAGRRGGWIRTRGLSRGHRCARAWTPRCAASSIPHFVACTTSTVLQPGVYRWPDLSSPVRAGAMRGSSTSRAWTRGSPATRRSS